jgi:hypothetical protein
MVAVRKDLICLLNRRRLLKNCRMKTSPALLLACALAIPSFAQGATTNAAPQPTSNQVTQVVLTLPAIFSFTITNAGNYVMQAVVNAPGEDSNSFYVNVDAQPEDPVMIWDIDVTNGFEERTVSWRGKGEAESDEFVPKRFNLSAGAHKLIIVGREPAQLKSISIRPAAN